MKLKPDLKFFVKGKTPRVSWINSRDELESVSAYALQSQVKDLMDDVKYIFKTFSETELAGYHSRDRKFVLDLLRRHVIEV